MKKFCMIAALATATLGLGSLVAQAGVAPSIGAAAKAAVQDSTAGIVNQVNWRRHHRHHHHRHHHHHHRQAYVYGYRRYR